MSAVSLMPSATSQAEPQVQYPQSPGEAERDAYLAETASLYRLKEGFNINYKGEYKARFSK
eukprot:113724-Pelagomonas_calceolata.AAC.1